MSHYPRTISSIGAVVRRDDSLLVARLTYSPTRGQYMLPGGIVEPGETLDRAVVRELHEETGIAARPLGIIGVTSIVYKGDTHTYVLWLMEPAAGEPLADGREVDHCCFMAFNEIAARDDVAYLVKYVAARLRQSTALLTQAFDYEQFVAGLDADTYKLFM